MAVCFFLKKKCLGVKVWQFPAQPEPADAESLDSSLTFPISLLGLIKLLVSVGFRSLYVYIVSP